MDSVLKFLGSIDWAKAALLVLGLAMIPLGFRSAVREANWRQLAWLLFAGVLVLLALLPVTHFGAFGSSFDLERNTQRVSIATDDKVDHLAAATDAELRKQEAQITSLSATSASEKAAAQSQIQTLTLKSAQAAQAYARAARDAAAARRKLAATTGKDTSLPEFTNDNPPVESGGGAPDILPPCCSIDLGRAPDRSTTESPTDQDTNLRPCCSTSGTGNQGVRKTTGAGSSEPRKP
jgi:hypothetical protein